jgi:hypothetical protein
MKVARRSLLTPSFNMKMAAVGSPKMLLNFYHTAWHHIPEDSTVQSACMSRNFKPYVQWHIYERILALVHYYEAAKAAKTACLLEDGDVIWGSHRGSCALVSCRLYGAESHLVLCRCQ